MEPTGEDGLHSVLLRVTIVGMDRRIGRVASIPDGHGRQGRTARGARDVIARLAGARLTGIGFCLLASHQ